ncbi:MAG: vWA domain-containing protein [Actinomycetota bacterium]
MTKLRTWIGAVLTVASLTIAPNSAKAQTTCEPPQPGEYLLLIISETGEKQERVRRALPEDVRSNVCRYLNDTVTRVAGFRNPQIASNWAQYAKEIVGLPAYIISGNNTPSAPQTTPTYTSVPSVSSFNPQPLGPGYAVLVDYLNQPEVANQVRQAAGKQVGLASYGQRPYLLVTYTTDKNAATSALQNLSDRGFLTILVDSRRVTLISPTVQ